VASALSVVNRFKKKKIIILAHEYAANKHIPLKKKIKQHVLWENEVITDKLYLMLRIFVKRSGQEGIQED